MQINFKHQNSLTLFDLHFDAAKFAHYTKQYQPHIIGSLINAFLNHAMW